MRFLHPLANMLRKIPRLHVKVFPTDEEMKEVGKLIDKE